MGNVLAGTLSACLQLVLYPGLRLILRSALFLSGRLWFFLLWLFWPVWVLALALGWLITSAESAQAGWFSWLWRDSGHTESIQRLEAANRALQSAAEVVNESSRSQAGQSVEVLSAIRALSNERTELAGSLERLAGLALQDSQWAAALNLAAPVFLPVSVLVVAALALWITHRSQPDDAAVLDVLLVEDLTQKAGQEGHVGFAISPAAHPAKSPPKKLPHRPFRDSRPPNQQHPHQETPRFVPHRRNQD